MSLNIEHDSGLIYILLMCRVFFSDIIGCKINIQVLL